MEVRIRPFQIGRGSSVVERIIGNDEVGSSILPRGTSFLSKQVT